ncbi:MAG: folate-binding protein [Sterolibacterium sp.]|nr:folate-binding protein [Sterolibacterium sp.]
MNSQWQDFLARQGLTEQQLDFGQPLAELQSAQTGAIMVPLTDLGLIRISGTDADSFLHNLLTNDVEGLPANGAHRSGLCTPKGRMLASFLVWRDADELLLALADDLHTGILKKLAMYVLRAKVKLADASDEQVVLGLSGPQLADTLAQLEGMTTLPDAPWRSSRFAQGQVLRISEQRYWLITTAAQAPALWQQLSKTLRPAGLNAWHWLEIAAGIPQITAATREEFTPQMINFELIGGVSFKKGCYPGQEIVARTQYLGKVKRRMYRGHVANLDKRPAIGTLIFDTTVEPVPCGMVVKVAASPQGGFDLLTVLQSASAETGQLQLAGEQDAGTAAQPNPGALLLLAPLPYAVT